MCARLESRNKRSRCVQQCLHNILTCYFTRSLLRNRAQCWPASCLFSTQFRPASWLRAGRFGSTAIVLGPQCHCLRTRTHAYRRSIFDSAAVNCLCISTRSQDAPSSFTLFLQSARREFCVFFFGSRCACVHPYGDPRLQPAVLTYPFADQCAHVWRIMRKSHAARDMAHKKRKVNDCPASTIEMPNYRRIESE